MEVLLQDLLPGQEYLLQLRSKNQHGTSQWSRAYSITTDSDVVSPSPVTGLSWLVSGTSFIGSWTKPTTDSDGGDLKDFKDFKVTLTADATVAIFYVTEERFDLSLERNIGLFGSPEPTVQIKVEVRDTIGNLSSSVTASASNPIPSDVTGLSLTPMLGGINVRWTKNDDDDFKKYELYSSTTSSAFTPSSSNLRYSGAGNAFLYTIGNTSTVYFKLRAIDVFDQPSANYATGSTAAYPIDGVPDSVAPSQPSAPTISTSTLVAQVSHNMTKQAGGSLESDVDYLEIHASTSSGFTPSDATLRGTIDSAGVGIPVSAAFFFPTTDSMTNLYWKVIAVDKSKNKSTASNQATGLPGLIENINILNATILDAKIQNLSAAKLIAGTAIVNDLFIESALTVSDTGFLESENYLSGSSGWKIHADGSVEFNDGTFRGDVLIESGGTTMLLSINSNGVPSIEIDGSSGGMIDIELDLLDHAFIEMKGSSGSLFSIKASDEDFSINRTNLSGQPSFHIKNNYGIYFRPGGSSTTVVFEEATGYLKSGSGSSTIETWTNASLQNGWTNTGGAYDSIGYRKMPDGTVLLRGAGTPGTTADGTTIFTLPTGYRPLKENIVKVVADGGTVESRIQINADGTVKIYSMSTTSGIRISGIRFPII